MWGNVDLSPEYTPREDREIKRGRAGQGGDPYRSYDSSLERIELIAHDFSSRAFLRRHVRMWQKEEARAKKHKVSFIGRISNDVKSIAYQWSLLILSEDELELIFRRYAALLNHARPRGVSWRRLNLIQKKTAIFYYWRHWANEGGE